MKVLRVLVVLVVLTVLTGPRLASAQTTAVGVIQGRVVDGVSGRPVSAVVVSILGAGMTVNSRATTGQVPSILTSGDGRFVFRGLTAPGSYAITAVKGGYAEGASGRRRPGGTSQPVQISAMHPSGDIVVRVWKNGAIAGTVLDEAGEPVVGVQMRLLSRATSRGRFSASGPGLVTDDRGAYRFSNLLPGDYLVIASPPVVSVKSTLFADVARTGRGSGELGMLITREASFLEAGDALVAVRPGAVFPPQTPGGRLRIYPTTFHPSAMSSAQATVVSLASGEERASIDVQLSPVPAVRVSGLLLNSSSAPAEMMPVRLAPLGSPDVPADLLAAVSSTDSSGAFAFAAVVPGQYSLRASFGGGRPGAGLDVSFVDLPMTVAGDDIDGVTAVLSMPPMVSGRYEFDGAAPRPAGQNGRPPSIFAMLDPVDPTPPSTVSFTAPSDPEDAFKIGGPGPGRYRVRVQNSPVGWMFKAAMLNGVDVSETPFELTRDITGLVLQFTDRWSGISGSVQGRNADEANVLVFPTEAQAWEYASSRRLKNVGANDRGEFGIGSLPPGTYYVVAVREEDAVDWRDPAFLEMLVRVATQVTILEGEHKKLDLQVREVRR